MAVQIFMFVSDGNEQAEPSQTYEKDLSTVDEVMTPANLVQNHDEFINAVKLRLTKLEVIPFLCTCWLLFVISSYASWNSLVNLHPTNRVDLLKLP